MVHKVPWGALANCFPDTTSHVLTTSLWGRDEEMRLAEVKVTQGSDSRARRKSLQSGSGEREPENIAQLHHSLAM